MLRCEPLFPAAPAGAFAISLSDCMVPFISSAGLTCHYAADICSGHMCPQTQHVLKTNMFLDILLILLIIN